MKQILFTITIFYLSIPLFGQQINIKRNILRLGINSAFYGSGDIIGTAIYGEYSYELGRIVSIAPRIFASYAHRKELYSSDYTLKTYGTNLSLRINPFPRSFHRLKFDVGLFYFRSFSEYGVNIDEYDNLGVLNSVVFNIFDTYKYELGIKTDMFIAFEGECLTCQIGVFGGYKF